MKYLVLGSSGQIGSSLCEYLISQGHEVKGIDIKNNPYDEDLRFSKFSLTKSLNDADFVFFLAWNVGGAKFLLNNEKTFEFIHDNIVIMSNVFSFLNITKKPFIFTSSQMSDMVSSVYGNTKLVGEKYTESLGGLCVKLWNVYGENDDIGEKSHAITDFISGALKDKKISVLTNGEEKRQFLYVKDCCEALYSLSQNYNSIPRDKNLHITNFKWYKIKNVAKIIANLTNSELEFGMREDRVQNNHKVKPDGYILNYWEPKTSLREGIKKIICSMKLKNI